MSKESPRKAEKRKAKREAYKPNPPKVKVGNHKCKFTLKYKFGREYHECTICGMTKIIPIPTRTTNYETKGAFGRGKILYKD